MIAVKYFKNLLTVTIKYISPTSEYRWRLIKLGRCKIPSIFSKFLSNPDIVVWRVTIIETWIVVSLINWLVRISTFVKSPIKLPYRCGQVMKKLNTHDRFITIKVLLWTQMIRKNTLQNRYKNFFRRQKELNWIRTTPVNTKNWLISCREWKNLSRRNNVIAITARPCQLFINLLEDVCPAT